MADDNGNVLILTTDEHRYADNAGSRLKLLGFVRFAGRWR